jgi:osmoprotectant transport system ATP-binding protein
VITFDGISKWFGDTVAVDNFSLAIPEGRICALVGPSGAGKSTVLRLTNRLIALDQGTIHVEGRDIAELAPVALRRRIGYVIQSVGLFPHWTVARNVATVPVLLGWPAKRVAARVDELVALVGLDPAIHRDRYPDELSGGQQQRVGVARALAGDPDLLLMDEPFGALDPVTRDDLQGALLAIRAATAKTILLVTHDIDEAIRLADQIAVLRDGRLVQQGTPRQILEHPLDDFVREFVGGAKLGLRLLKVVTVRDRMQPLGEHPHSPADVFAAIDASAHLDEALARMVASGARSLPVADGAAGIVGCLALDDIVGPS